MGVPGLFSFFRRRYPAICHPTEKRNESTRSRNTTDNLYIDMNHIIHSCTHAHVAKDRPELTREEQFAGMAAYLETLLELLEPRRVVFVAVDGVAPRAKMNQQRTRRFLSAYISGVTNRIEQEIKREMVSEAGGNLDIPEVKRFDSNIITPGTDFMMHLATWLRAWAASKAATDPRFSQTAFIISDASEPGEGEHKIMKFVRQLKLQAGYDANTTHVVYGQDADLLLLTLVCHEPHFRVMREDMNAQAAKTKTAQEAAMAEQQQQILQQRPLSAVAAALQQQQQLHPEFAALPTLPLVTQQSEGTLFEPCSDHLHMPCFETVDIAVLRECIQWEFAELVGRPGPLGMYRSDEESDVLESEITLQVTEASETRRADEEEEEEDSSKGLAKNHDADVKNSGAAGAAGASNNAVLNDSGEETAAAFGDLDGHESSADLDDLLDLISYSNSGTPAAAAAAINVAESARPSAEQLPGLVAAAASTSCRQGSMGTRTPLQQQAHVSSTSGIKGCRSNSSSSDSGSSAGAAAERRLRQRGKPGLSFESLLDDLVVLSFLAGNDFLPNVPSIDIYDKPCGLDLLFAAYKHLLPQLGGHISGSGSVNRSRLVQLLVFLARDEEPAYKRRADYRRRRAQQQREKDAAAKSQLNALFDGGLSMGELPPGVDMDALLAGLDPSTAEAMGLSSSAPNRPPPPDLLAMPPGKLCEELSNRVALRVKDRLMGGDPWAQDPLSMDLPGYRQRYYEARFPELLNELNGDVDKVAALVSTDYLAGISWVLRYYTCGPAAIQWQQDQHGSHDTAAAAAAAVEGASWTWCYPHHYAPLMQDLSKVKLWQKHKSSRQQFSAPPVAISRSIQQPHCCALHEWAPWDGPVRPLLQLMCVLPAKSVGDALPQPLANLIVLADAMDADPSAASRAQPSKHKQQQHSAKANRRAARKARQAAVAEKIVGLSGLSVLSALEDGDEAQLLSDPFDRDEPGSTDSDSSERDAKQQQQQQQQGANGQLAPVQSGQGETLSFVMSGNPELDLLKLAQQLCSTFPNNVEMLVDLTGKRWLHTGVVRLPMAEPQLVAAVLQAALTLQQDGSLSAPELLFRNAFRPAAVVTTEKAAAAAAAIGDGAANSVSGDSHTAQLNSTCIPIAPGSSSSCGGNGSGGSTVAAARNAWTLFTNTASIRDSAAAAAAATATSRSAPAASSAVPATAAAVVPGLGALGVLLGQRGAVHCIPSSTMQCLPKPRPAMEQQVPVWEADLDVAGLPVPQHNCCLVEGAEPPALAVTQASWRHVAAGFSSAIGYAEKVLGIRGSSSSSSGHEASGGRGRGGSARDWGGGRGGFGSGGRESRDDRGRRGRGSSSRGGYRYKAESPIAGCNAAEGYRATGQQQYHQQQQQYLDPAYYYIDDYETGNVGRSAFTATSSGGYRGHPAAGGSTYGRGFGRSRGRAGR